MMGSAAGLSGREKAIFEFWREGMTDSEIAGKLACTVEFVGATRRRLEVAENKFCAKKADEAGRLVERTLTALWREGLTDQRIAERLGCARSTVFRIRTKLGLARVPRTSTSKVDDRELRRLHAAGKTDAQMAEVFGVKLSTIRPRRAKLGLVRNRAVDGARRPGPQAFTEAELRAAHSEGLTDQELSERLNATTTVVGHWRREYGLPVIRALPEVEISEPAAPEEMAPETPQRAMLRRAARCAFALTPQDPRLLPMLEPLVAEEMRRVGA